MENCLEERSTPPQINEVVSFVIPRSYMPTRGVVGYANETRLNTTSTLQWGVCRCAQHTASRCGRAHNLLRSTWRSTQATEDSPLVEGVDSLKHSV
jgi:hypothetical protein